MLTVELLTSPEMYWDCWIHTFVDAYFQSLVIPEKFQHILRVLNTNIDGRRKIAFAITAIKVSFRLWAMLRVSL